MDPLLVPEPPPPAAAAPPPALPEAVRAWFVSRPRLRPVNITPQRLDGRPAYVLENPVSSAFYRVGEREFRFLERLDGRRTVAEILARQAATPESALEPGIALRLLETLKAEGLLENVEAQAPRGGGATGAGWLDRVGGILYMRISLGNPDRLFAWLSGRLGWLVHPLAWIAGFGAIAVGGLALLRQTDRMRDATLGVLAPHNWLWIGILFVLLRAVHETWHGLTCRRLGARVRDIGVLLILFFPVGYTDVTSGWGLPSRWHRFLISVAGIYVELVLAAAAALVWTNTGPGVVNTLAWQTVLTAGASSLVVNLNPLMRFDGYYVFTDLLDLPNLYARGQILMRAAARRYLLGVREQELPPLRDRGWRAAAVYGPASLVWRFFVLTNILAATAALLHGAGIALALLCLVAWGRRPALAAWRWARAAPARTLARVALRTALAAGAVGAVLMIPWRPGVVEPALVDWADRVDVYAGCPGLLAAVSLPPGSRVGEGAEVVRIENPDLEAEAERLRVGVEREELRERIALREDDLSGWSASHAALAALRDEWDHAVEKAGRRIMTAPASGVLWDHRLDRRLGQHVREGELLFTMGHPVDREAVVLVPQERYALYGLRVGDEAEVWVPGRDRVRAGRIASIGPAAGRGIEQPALTALGGGHVAVQGRPRDGGAGYEMHEAQFEVRVRIEGPEASDLQVGERGYLRAREGPPIPLARLAAGRLERFWNRLLARRR